ncbi:MAG: hypothetical protein GX657_12195 [Chloroflexi bacterium]|nr:hypothetical protein [Chloroflexota bacterium]
MDHWPLSDMHVHATRYRLEGARQEMTVANIARHLESLGCQSAGIVEHLDTAPKHPLSCLEHLVAEFRTVRSSCALYVGAELDFQGQAISIPDAAAIKERLGLDFYLAAAHGVGEGVRTVTAFIEDHHRRLMGIVTRCPYVDVVAHPWVEAPRFAERGRIDRWDWSLVPEHYLREFVEAAAAHGKAIEISRKALSSADSPVFRAFLGMIRDAGARVTTSTDAHSMAEMGNLARLTELLAAAGLAPASLWQPAAS